MDKVFEADSLCERVGIDSGDDDSREAVETFVGIVAEILNDVPDDAIPSGWDRMKADVLPDKIVSGD